LGLVGAGSPRNLKIVAGVLKRDFSTAVDPVHDKPVRYRVAGAGGQGRIAYFTEDRKVEGFSNLLRRAQIYLADGEVSKGRMMLSRRKTMRSARPGSSGLKVRTIDRNGKVVRLSGAIQTVRS